MDVELIYRGLQDQVRAVLNAENRGEPIPAVADMLAANFALLDSHLSGGGRPPEAWAEGPDAPELDALNERIDQALLDGYRKAQKANHATILRLEDEIYALRNGEPRRTCVRCGHEVARYPSGWAHTAPGNGGHDAELAEWPKDRGFFTYDENGRRVVPEPLGGPVPGVDGSHLPESSEHRAAPLAGHVAVFPAEGTTKCSCGEFAGTTYVGWKRHYQAAKRGGAE